MPELGIRRKLLVRRMSRSSGLGNACSAVQGLSDGACCEPSGTLIISGCGTSRHAHHLGLPALTGESVRALERGFWRGFSGPGIEMPGKSPRRSSVAAGEVPRGRESRWLANFLGRSSTGSDGPARGRESRCRRISSGVRARLLANTLATACRAVRRDLWARFIISGCGTFRHAHHLGMRDLPEYSRCMGLPPVFMSGSRKCLHDVASVGRSVVV